MKTSLFGVLFAALALAVPPLSVPALAQTPSPAPKKADLEKVAEGEMRLDGRLSAILGSSDWSMKAFSFTSPRGVTKEFDEPREKSVRLSATTFIHPIGETLKVAPREVKVGTSLAVIGKNGPDGTLIAREIVLLEGYGARKTVGTLTINPISSALIDQSRKLRDGGQISKAIDAAQKAADAARGLGDRSGEALCQRDLALLYLDTKQWEKSIAASLIVEKTGRETGIPLALVMGLAGRANALSSQGKHDAALPLLQEAQQNTSGLSATLQQSVTRSLIYGLLAVGQIENAIPQIETMAKLEEEAGQPDEATQSRLMVALFRAKEQPEAAREALEKGSKSLENVRQENERGGLLASVAFLQWRLGQKDAARENFKKAQAFYAAQGNPLARKMEQIPAFLDGAPDENKTYLKAMFAPDLSAETTPAQAPQPVE